MEVFMEYWIWLSIIEKKAYSTIKQLLEKYQKPEKIWSLSETELKKLKIEENVIQEMINPNYRKNLKVYARYMHEKKIQILM